MEDIMIIDLYWERNQQAITETDSKYGKYLRKVSFNVLHSTEDCEECVNDTFFKAWNSMPPERPGVLSAFLATITRNLSLDLYRKRTTKKRGEGQVEEIFDELLDYVGSESPENEVVGNELKDIINGFLETLNVENRVIFMRRYWYFDSTREISDSLQIGESKVKTSLFRTRKKLAEYLLSAGYSV